jgi:putative hemolysin
MEAMELLDVEGALHTRWPAFARRLPSPAISGLRRFLHEEEINVFLRENPELRGRAFAEGVLDHLAIEVTARGAPLPSDGRAIFVCNHPTGGLDGLAVLSVLGRRYGEVRIVANDLLLHIEPMREVFVPVDAVGGPMPRAGASALREVLASDVPVVVFPAGEVSKLSLGGVHDVRWRPSFARWAARSGRPVVPLFLRARASALFHGISVARRTLRARFHWEMAALPDVLSRQRGRRAELVVGEPIVDVSGPAARVAARCRAASDALAVEVPT